MPIADAILMEMDQEGQTTKRVLDRIPENKLTWKPHPKAFSLGQLALHLAAAPGALAVAVAADSFEVPSFVQAEAKTRQEVLDTFAKSMKPPKPC